MREKYQKRGERLIPQQFKNIPNICPDCNSKDLKFWRFGNLSVDKPLYKCLHCKKGYLLEMKAKPWHGVVKWFKLSVLLYLCNRALLFFCKRKILITMNMQG
jgi:DNA-directed RNA polymerase subunit RPC12/RpoP